MISILRDSERKIIDSRISTLLKLKSDDMSIVDLSTKESNFPYLSTKPLTNEMLEYMHAAKSTKQFAQQRKDNATAKNHARRAKTKAKQK